MKWPGSCAATIFVILASQRKNIRIISWPDCTREMDRVVGKDCMRLKIVATGHRRQLEVIPRNTPTSHSWEPS